MKRLAAVLALFLSHGVARATDFIIPEPVTYEWTVKATQRVIPVVEWKGTIGEAIGYLGDSMEFPLRLHHDLPEEVLKKRVDWKMTKATWLQLVAKIADVADADIIIGKREVTLKRRKPEEKAEAGDGGKPVR